MESVQATAIFSAELLLTLIYILTLSHFITFCLFPLLILTPFLKITYLFMAKLGLCCYTHGLSLVAANGLLSLVAMHGLLLAMTSCCGAQALDTQALVVVWAQ